MTDIAQRLKSSADEHRGDMSFRHRAEMREGAAEIERLTAEIERLRAALRPFADYADARDAIPMTGLGDVIHGIHCGTPYGYELRLSHCKAARAALPSPPTQEGGE